MMETGKNVYSKRDYYARLCAGKIPVTIFLVNGFQMRATIQAVDDDTILADCDGWQKMIYQHAISTIDPNRPVNLSAAPDAGFLPYNDGKPR